MTKINTDQNCSLDLAYAKNPSSGQPWSSPVFVEATEEGSSRKNTKPPAQSIFEKGQIDPPTPNFSATYEEYVAHERKAGRIVEHSSREYIQLRRLLDEVALALRVEPDTVRFDIVQTPQINAWVIRGEDDAFSHVFITTGLLGLLSDERGRTSAGQVAAVFGHELGHVIEGHYNAAKPLPKTRSEDPIEVEIVGVEQLTHTVIRSLEHRVFSRNQEFQADKHGVEALMTLGFAPDESLRVLESLKDISSGTREREHRIIQNHKAKVWIAEKLLETHPGLDGRIAYCKGVIHQLTIDAIGRAGPAALSQPVREECIELGDLAKSSTLQERLTLLKDIASQVRASQTISSEQLEQLMPTPPASTDRQAFDGFMAEARHLYLLTPMLLRHALKCVPYLPWDDLAEQPSDMELPLGHSMDEESAEVLERFTDRLYKLVDQVCRAELETRNDDLKGQLEVLVDRWAGIDSVYKIASTWRGEIEKELQLLHQQDRALSMQVLSERGVVHFDTSVIDRRIFEDMISEGGKSSPVSKRGVLLTKLLRYEREDLRAGLFERLTKDDFFDGATKTDVANFAQQLHRMFQEQAVSWRSAHKQGQRLGMWAMETFEAPTTSKRIGQWKQFIQNLSCQTSSLISEPECNPLVIGCLDVLEPGDFKKGGKNPSLQQFLKHLGGLLDAGINRDCVLLSQLVERQDTLKAELISNTNRLSRSDPSAFADVTPVLEELDLSWYTLKLRRGAIDLQESAEESTDSRQRPADAGTAWLDRDSELPPEVFTFNRDPQLACVGPRTAAGSAAREVLMWYLEQSEASLSGKEIGRLLMKRDGNSPLAISAAEFGRLPIEGNFIKDSLQPAGYSASEIPKTSALMRALVLDGNCEYVATSSEQELDDGIIEYFAQLPQGELRDYAILKVLAHAAAPRGLAAEIERIEQLDVDQLEQKCAALRAMRMDLDRGHTSGMSRLPDDVQRDVCLKLLTLLSEHKDGRTGVGALPIAEATSVEALRRVYTNQSEFIRAQLDVSAVKPSKTTVLLPVTEPRAIATSIAKVLFKSFEDYATKKSQMSPQERINIIHAYFVYPSEIRDALLKEVLDDARANQQAQTAASPPSSAIAQQIYDLYLAPHLKHALGRELYQQWQASDEAIHASFGRQLEILKRYHEPGTVSYEVALKTFLDGGVSSTGDSVRAQVRTWEEYDRVVASLQEGDAARVTDFRRLGAFQSLQELLQEDCVPAQDKAATLLWLAGLRTSSHVVDCYEVVYKVKADSLKSEAELLTEAEKRQLLQEVLGGQHGILRDTESARKDFLNALFAGVFGKRDLPPNDRRAFKAVFDALLHYSPPERAAGYLAAFLVSHLDGKSFNEQIKLFFSSFGFVGVKTAQYLATRTNLLSPELRAELMDLTSRVPGPDKRVVFKALESVMGSDARQAVHSVGDHLGGGSLMTFYEVTLWNEDKSGPGQSGVVGLLRPDIVHALPEDLLLVRRVLEGMRDAPEYFAGKVISTGLMDNLVWQSAVETNLERTAALQEQMRRDLESFVPTDRSVSVRIPEVWHSSGVVGKEINLTRGPLIFMERGKGVTLDRFLEGKAENDPQVKKALQALSETLAFQLRQGTCVHCDLHHGNVLVTEDNGQLDITILDVGLSVELNPEISRNLYGIAQMFMQNEALRPTQEASEQLKRRLVADETMQLIGRFVDALGERNGVEIDQKARERALTSLAHFMTDTDTPIQERITGVTSEIEKLGFTLPGEYYYLTRGLAVSSYIWATGDSERQALVLRGLTERGVSQPDVKRFDIDKILGSVESVVVKLGGRLERESAQQLLTQISEARGLAEILAILEKLPEIIMDVSVDEVLTSLANDKYLFKQLGIEELLNVFESGGAEATERSSHNQFMQLAQKLISVESRPIGAAKVDAEAGDWGYRPRVWSQLPPPGGVVQVVTAGGRERFQVELYNPSVNSGDDITLLTPVDRRPIDYASKISKARKNSSVTDAKAGKMHGKRLALYTNMIDRLEKPSLYENRRSSIGEVINQGGEVTVADGENWRSVAEFLYDPGEEKTKYLVEVERNRKSREHGGQQAE